MAQSTMAIGLVHIVIVIVAVLTPIGLADGTEIRHTIKITDWRIPIAFDGAIDCVGKRTCHTFAESVDVSPNPPCQHLPARSTYPYLSRFRISFAAFHEHHGLISG